MVETPCTVHGLWRWVPAAGITIGRHVIIGARNEQQLRDNLAAAAWSLSAAEVERLDEASAMPLPYPYWHQQKFGFERNPPLKQVR